MHIKFFPVGYIFRSFPLVPCPPRWVHEGSEGGGHIWSVGATRDRAYLYFATCRCFKVPDIVIRRWGKG